MKFVEREHPRLLIVEDEAGFRATLEVEFQERGYEVLCAGSVSEVPDIELSELQFAIVDLRLGSESGLDAVSLIRGGAPLSRILVLTGYGSIATAVEAMKRGASHYLTKPVSIDALERALWEDPALADPALVPAETLAQHERDFIESVLLQCEGNVSAAAKRLGIHRQSLQRKLRKFRPS